MSTLKKPHIDAIQTVYGWALPKTGEILVSTRRLPNPVSGFKIGRPWKSGTTPVKAQISQPVIKKVEIPTEIEEPVIEKVEIPTEIEEPVIETAEESFEEMVAEVVIKPKRVQRKKSVQDVTE